MKQKITTGLDPTNLSQTASQTLHKTEQYTHINPYSYFSPHAYMHKFETRN